MELTIVVNRVLYPAESVENANWFILETSEGICKGNMGWRPREKERLKLIGKYGEYQGQREFKFKEATLDIPEDPRAMLHYVCEMASGIGASMEDQIWELEGENWPNIEEGILPRLNGKVFQNFMEAIEAAEEDRAKGETISKLLDAGCSMNMASAAFERWAAETLGIVSNNPYRLTELPNYGFADVDGRVRIHYGIGDSDPRRIRAAVVYVIKQITGNGSTLVGWNVFLSECIKRLGGMQDLIISAVGEMFNEGTLKPFHASESLALGTDYKNETLIWEFLNNEKSVSSS